MRYFTRELWLGLNNSDENIRVQAENEWKRNSMYYQHQFSRVKRHLSCKFINNFLSREGLHDYVIRNIIVNKQDHTYSCELTLTNEAETILVVMKGITKLKIDVASFQHCIQGALTWGYSEFDITPKNIIRLALLCDMDNEMLFEFKTISLKNITGISQGMG